MPETTTVPGEQTPEPQPAQGTQQQAAPEGFIEKERYTGAIQKIEALTNSQKEIQSELAAKSSKVEQLSGSLAEMEATHQSALGERTGKIEELQGKLGEMETQIQTLTAMKTKVDVLKEMGRPDLLPLVEHLPNVTDPEVLKAVVNDFANTMDGAVKAREKQLLEGVVETSTNPGTTVPQTRQEWIKHIESLPLGSDKRSRALDTYGEWLQKAQG